LVFLKKKVLLPGIEPLFLGNIARILGVIQAQLSQLLEKSGRGLFFRFIARFFLQALKENKGKLCEPRFEA
jgi:hypothetical protein